MNRAAPSFNLARELAEAIAAGRHPVGSLLPTEMALCEQYGLSRYAVRRALDELQELGLISRRKNVGTRVEAAQPAAGFTQAVATLDELALFGAQHTRQIWSTESVVADLTLAETLGCAGGSRWLRISSLRMEPGPRARPMGWTDVYVDEAFAEVGEMVKHSPGTLISTLIEGRYGRVIARIRQELQAIALPADLAGPLQADEGSPALQIIRRYIDNAGEVLQISRSVHPAQRFKFSNDLLRSRE